MTTAAQVQNVVSRVRQLRTEIARTEALLERLAQEEAEASERALQSFGTSDVAALTKMASELEAKLAERLAEANGLLAGDEKDEVTL